MSKNTTAERFWAKVNKTDTCWLWTASTKGAGYGQYIIKGKSYLSHRLSYEMLVGLIPEGLVIDHLCKVKTCVNPKHLEAVTQYENMMRSQSGAYLKARTHCPRNHPYLGTNLYVSPSGGRFCRACRRVKGRSQIQ